MCKVSVKIMIEDGLRICMHRKHLLHQNLSHQTEVLCYQKHQGSSLQQYHQPSNLLNQGDPHSTCMGQRLNITSVQDNAKD